jgi:hypothetical protein
MVELPEHLTAVHRGLTDVCLRVVRLIASLEILADRIRQREIGSGRDWHLRPAVELVQAWEAQSTEDALVETLGHSVTAIAEEVVCLSSRLKS